MPRQGVRKGEDQDQPDREEFERHGHRVVITGEGEGATLLVDGRLQRFFIRGEGYALHAAAYRPPSPSLREAVEAYLDTLAEQGTGKNQSAGGASS